MNTVEIALKHFETATCPEEVFGTLTGAEADQLTRLHRQFHELARVVHPDLATHPLAGEAMRLLLKWKELAEQKIKQKGYGATSVMATIHSKTDEYQLVSVAQHGDIAELYLGTRASSSEQVIVKIVREARDNDLMETEVRVLKHLQGQSDAATKHFRQYLPTFHDAFSIVQNRTAKSAHVFRFYAEVDDYFSLERVLSAFPNGVDTKTAAWMFNRILEVLIWTHGQNIIHGAVLPAHILIHQIRHGAKLIDWCYAVEDVSLHSKPLKALSSVWKDYYPPEVFEKKPATAALDIYLAATCMVKLLGGDIKTGELPHAVPKPIERLLNTCRIPNPHRRFGDAKEVYDLFRDILQKQYGPPSYHPFHMPS